MEKEIIAKWKIRESERNRILALLSELAEKTRAEEGNILYAVYQSETDPNVIILHERYRDNAAADAHRQSAHYQRIVVNEIIPNLEIRDVTVVKKLM
jgi:quinol monooxygenase YgiN